MKKTLLAAAFGTLALLPVAALAQHHGPHGGGNQGSGHHGAGPHGGHGPARAGQADTPSTKAFRVANEKMHKDMDIRFSGDADVDFFAGMIPHHQGAIDMARVVLQHGKDPETRKMAEEIIAAQEKEIAFMREWLKKKGQ